MYLHSFYFNPPTKLIYTEMLLSFLRWHQCRQCTRVLNRKFQCSFSNTQSSLLQWWFGIVCSFCSIWCIPMVSRWTGRGDWLTVQSFSGSVCNQLVHFLFFNVYFKEKIMDTDEKKKHGSLSRVVFNIKHCLNLGVFFHITLHMQSLAFFLKLGRPNYALLHKLWQIALIWCSHSYLHFGECSLSQIFKAWVEGNPKLDFL